MTQTLQGALQARLRELSGGAADFNGDAVAAAGASNVTGALIDLAQTLDPSIDAVTAATNYLLSHYDALETTP